MVVDWPHKAESKSYFPPKGLCLVFWFYSGDFASPSSIPSPLMCSVLLNFSCSIKVYNKAYPAHALYSVLFELQAANVFKL